VTDFPPAPVPGPRGSRGRGVRATLGVARAPGATLLLAALALLAGCGRTEPERVVLVTIDTLRADHVGAYGDPDARTPTLDGLAEQGVLFETALSPVPLTLPTHASLLTALDPPRHGVRHNSVFSLDPGIPTLAERMQASGRATAAFVGALVLHHRFGLDRGFDVYDDRMGERRSSRVSGFAERRADAVVDAVLDWLETAPERFFLWVHFYDPHADYDPPMAYAVGFASRPYDGEIAFADAELGRMLAAIDARFDPDGTWVTVTSDHGESLGEHGEPTHSFTLYDATQKVPLVMRGPGLPAGLRVAAPARLIDVAPTLLAGIGAPPLPDVDGRDLAPLVAGRETEPRVAYMETLATKLELGWAPLFALRDDRHKYIRAPRPELYDLPRDPGELENLAPSAPQATARWEATLARELEGERPLVPSVALSEADRNQLESLGYLVPDAAAVEAAARAPTGPDPKDEIWLLDVLLRAARHIGRDRGAEALAVLAEAGDRGGAQVAGLRAQAALVAGDAVAAEAHAREALALAPDRSDTRLMLGEALLAQRRFDAAAEVLLRAREDAPESSRAIVGLARVAEARGEREEAIGLLRLALRPEAGRAAGVPGFDAALEALNLGQMSVAMRCGAIDQLAKHRSGGPFLAFVQVVNAHELVDVGGPGVDLAEQLLDQGLSLPAVALAGQHHLGETILTEALLVGIHGLDETVGIEHQHVAGGEVDGLLPAQVGIVRQDAQGHADRLDPAGVGARERGCAPAGHDRDGAGRAAGAAHL